MRDSAGGWLWGQQQQQQRQVRRHCARHARPARRRACLGLHTTTVGGQRGRAGCGFLAGRERPAMTERAKRHPGSEKKLAINSGGTHAGGGGSGAPLLAIWACSAPVVLVCTQGRGRARERADGEGPLSKTSTAHQYVHCTYVSTRWSLSSMGVCVWG